MRWVVYVVRCRDGSLYTGITNALAARVAKHNEGKGAKYTRSRRPVKVVWTRRCASEGEARRREREVKGMTRGEKLKMVRGRNRTAKNAKSAKDARRKRGNSCTRQPALGGDAGP